MSIQETAGNEVIPALIKPDLESVLARGGGGGGGGIRK